MMNAKERLLAVYRGEKPDRVPVQPCFAYLLPMRRTGLPFNKFTGDFARQVLETYRYFGADARVWLPIGGRNPAVEYRTSIQNFDDGTQVITTTAAGPAGSVRSRIKTFPDAAPAPLERPVKDLRRQLEECISEAAGGPFILSTGDQVSDLTPEENIRAFCEAGRKATL